MDGSRAISLAPPNIGDRERSLVERALRSSNIAYGEIVAEFERDVARELERQHAVALISGTAALHLALLTVGVVPGDEVLLPTLTFVAPANAVRYAGAHPVLFDAEPDYRQMDVRQLASWLEDHCEMTSAGTVNHRTGRRVAAVIAVGLLGHPSDISALRAVTDPYGISIIDDAAESLGARAYGGPVGRGADIVCLSFNANKIVTSGGGGMLLCDCDQIAERTRHLASQAKEPGEGYDHSEVGFNYRLPSAASALGLGQFRRLDEFVAKKRAIATRYRDGLRDLGGVRLPREAAWAEGTDWLFTVHIEEDSGFDSASLRRRLGESGIQTRPVFTPLHRTRAHLGSEAHDCPTADELHRTGVTLPSSTSLTDDDQDRVIEAIRQVAADLRPAPAPRS